MMHFVMHAYAIAGPYALVGKGLQETYIMHELTDPPQPGPEQQALALCQIDGKVASFKIMVKVDTFQYSCV